MRRVKGAARRAADGPARALGRLGLSPNALTVLGSVLTASVGLLAAQGWFLAAGVCLWLFSATDTLDGALARATNRVSPFGAFLDSVCDRYAELCVFLGLLWWYEVGHDTPGVVLTYAAATGSFMVSYARARAEGIGQGAEVGWFQRPERILVLGLGFLVAPVLPQALLAALVLLAGLTHLTVLQRVLHVAALTRARAGQPTGYNPDIPAP
jgi:CDP-diacylglycerol---glycerol-3-phosphate 3-phosphatidyltransferase